MQPHTAQPHPELQLPPPHPLQRQHPQGPPRPPQTQPSPRPPNEGSPNRAHRNGTGPDLVHHGNGSRSRPQMTDLEFLDVSQVQVESSSSSDSDFSPRRPARPVHSRSMSHPFPSLFSGWKKKNEDPGAATGRPDPRSHGDEGRLLSTSAPRRPQHRSGRSLSDKDFTTGNCMTCGSMVRWPRDLVVFKCTICLTINDLRPTDREPKNYDIRLGRCARDDEPSSSSPAVGSTFVQPIAAEHTKLLVRQCLRTFLSLNLSRNSARDSLSMHLHPTAPVSPVSPSDGRTCPAEFDHGALDAHAPVFVTPGALADGPLDKPIPRVRTNSAAPRSYSTSCSDQRPSLQGFSLSRPRRCDGTQAVGGESSDVVDGKKIFKPLEDYIINCFASWRCLSSSFGGVPLVTPRSRLGRDSRSRPPESRVTGPTTPTEVSIEDLDAKMLLLGDFAENGSWWTGGGDEATTRAKALVPHNGVEEAHVNVAMTNCPSIDWVEMDDWYDTVVNAGQPWKSVYEEIVAGTGGLLNSTADADLQHLESQILVAQDHTQKVLLKATEMILKRPGRPLSEPSDLRFLLLILANPLLHANRKTFSGEHSRSRSRCGRRSQGENVCAPRDSNTQARGQERARVGSGPTSGRHSGLIKRVLGLVSNSSTDCHNQFVAWLATLPDHRFVEAKDLVSGFLTYRLVRQNEKKQELRVDMTGGLVPSISAGQSVATLHAALGQSSGPSTKTKDPPKRPLNNDDWQIKAAARVLTLIFAANDHRGARHGGPERSLISRAGDGEVGSRRGRVHVRSQLLPTSDFYVSLLDDSDLLADFEAWESRRGSFSFCQYPFLLSVWAKIQILEHDAKRQMQKKARDAFFDSIMSRRTYAQYLNLNVRRDCLVEDSLKAVSEVVGSGGEDIKKGLRISFRGEEGVDAGGLRKEWFLLLVRELFNPDHGMFVYDEDSRYCYFNPKSFETSDQYFLVGVVVGLAIYNSTILDIAFPPFAFRKLLAAAPPPVGGAPTPSHSRPPMTYTLDDLAEFRPGLARGLRQLLDYDGDVESTFCLDFAVDVERYGSVERVALVPLGEKRPVTNSNRGEFVSLYVRYLLDSSVWRQFDPFKRGFFTVCGGNALSLFRPEEIELLVRGSEEPLDISSLRAVAQYDGWKRRPGAGGGSESESEDTIRWFWDSFEESSPLDQRKLLIFITGSDRIPAMGATSLVLRLVCLGDDCERYPTARTCFNTLALWRYRSKERLEAMLWDAVNESEGFGLK